MQTFKPIKTVTRNLTILSLILIFGCKQEFGFYEGYGLKPVYLPKSELSDIRNLEPQPTEKTGPILLLGNLFFMVEQKKGLHVFDVTNLANPIKISFIKIPAVNDFSIANNILLADNGPNLVSIDINDIHNVVVLNIEEDVFQQLLYPANYSGFFECADNSKGIIVDWVESYSIVGKCRTLN